MSYRRGGVTMLADLPELHDNDTTEYSKGPQALTNAVRNQRREHNATTLIPHEHANMVKKYIR